MPKHIHPHLLILSDYHAPVLRETLEPVCFPLSAEDKQIIRDMKYSIRPEQLKKANAPWSGASGMAANQWGLRKRIFLYCPDGSDTRDLDVIINPSYEPWVDKLVGTICEDNAWEGCFSVPAMRGFIKRYTCIQASYQDEKGKKITRELNGWYARVFQHETDHLNGLLYDDPLAGKCLDLMASKKE